MIGSNNYGSIKNSDKEPHDKHAVSAEDETKIKLNLNIKVNGVTQRKNIMIPLIRTNVNGKF